MILYHGSNVTIEEIDLDRCRPNKDFGRGFYLTDIEDQAKRMAVRTSKRYGGDPVVTAFEFDDEKLVNFNVKIFEKADLEWAKFVMRNRKWEDENIEPHQYDIVIGPVADDAMATLFRNFDNHFIDEEGLLNGLKFSKTIVTSQFYFRTPESILLLKRL